MSEKEIESHKYLQRRLKVYNMFRGSQVSRKNSDVSVNSHRSAAKAAKLEAHSEHEDEPCEKVNLKRNHSQAFGHDKVVQTSFKSS